MQPVHAIMCCTTSALGLPSNLEYRLHSGWMLQGTGRRQAHSSAGNQGT